MPRRIHQRVICLGMFLYTAIASASGGTLLAPRGTCTTTNCASGSAFGIITEHLAEGGITHRSQAWSQNIAWYGGPINLCLRLDVTGMSQAGLGPDNPDIPPAELAMTATLDNGTVLHNDDKGSGSCPTCPRLVIALDNTRSGDVNVTLQVDQAFGGYYSRHADFQLRYGVYDMSHSNCAGAIGGTH